MANKKATETEGNGGREGQLASMPNEFECPNCGAMIYHGSKPGVEVACPQCGERAAVPS